jgi:hypothetical protein
MFTVEPLPRTARLFSNRDRRDVGHGVNDAPTLKGATLKKTSAARHRSIRHMSGRREGRIGEGHRGPE